MSNSASYVAWGGSVFDLTQNNSVTSSSSSSSSSSTHKKTNSHKSRLQRKKELIASGKALEHWMDLWTLPTHAKSFLNIPNKSVGGSSMTTSSSSGGGGNSNLPSSAASFSQGYSLFSTSSHSSLSSHLQEDILDRVRWFLEDCDQADGLHVWSDTQGIWGGATVATLMSLRDDFEKLPIFSATLANHQPYKFKRDHRKKGFISATSTSISSAASAFNEIDEDGFIQSAFQHIQSTSSASTSTQPLGWSRADLLSNVTNELLTIAGSLEYATAVLPLTTLHLQPQHLQKENTSNNILPYHPFHASSLFSHTLQAFSINYLIQQREMNLAIFLNNLTSPSPLNTCSGTSFGSSSSEAYHNLISCRSYLSPSIASETSFTQTFPLHCNELAAPLSSYGHNHGYGLLKTPEEREKEARLQVEREQQRMKQLQREGLSDPRVASSSSSSANDAKNIPACMKGSTLKEVVVLQENIDGPAATRDFFNQLTASKEGPAVFRYHHLNYRSSPTSQSPLLSASSSHLTSFYSCHQSQVELQRAGAWLHECGLDRRSRIRPSSYRNKQGGDDDDEQDFENDDNETHGHREYISPVDRKYNSLIIPPTPLSSQATSDLPILEQYCATLRSGTNSDIAIIQHAQEDDDLEEIKARMEHATEFLLEKN